MNAGNAALDGYGLHPSQVPNLAVRGYGAGVALTPFWQTSRIGYTPALIPSSAAVIVQVSDSVPATFAAIGSQSAAVTYTKAPIALTSDAASVSSEAILVAPDDVDDTDDEIEHTRLIATGPTWRP